jgi:hypothetical protein
MFQFDFSTSFITDFNLSSKSHLYLAHASNVHISRVIILFHLRLSGTSFSAIFLAIHSIIAVFQTHGSPISTGLFFVLLDNICNVLLISSSLHITGSIFQAFAISTKSIQYFFRAFSLLSGSLSTTFSHFLIFVIISFTFGIVIRNVFSISFVLLSQKSIIAMSKCSSVINLSLFNSATFSASTNTLFRFVDKLSW